MSAGSTSSPWAGRARPPSPRTLHERLGLPEQHSGPTASHTLLDRVAGIRGGAEASSLSAKAARHITWPAITEQDAAVVGQDQPAFAAQVTSLDARIAQDPQAWPMRGQEATSQHNSGRTSAVCSSSDANTSDRDNSRHITSSRSSDTARPGEAHIEDRGRIRVSEEGEVYRSPPHRLARQDSLSENSSIANTAHTGSRTRNFTTISSSMSSALPIDLTKEPDSTAPEKPAFSPLPPFARTSSGPSTSNGPYRGVPPQGFRRPSGYGRQASRPPQIASTSGTRYESSDAYDTYRPPPSRRTSYLHQPTHGYSAYQGSRGRALARYHDRARNATTNGTDNHRTSPHHDVQEPAWRSRRSSPILASPAPSQMPGEELDLHASKPRAQFSNKTWDNPSRTRRSVSPLRPSAQSIGKRESEAKNKDHQGKRLASASILASIHRSSVPSLPETSNIAASAKPGPPAAQPSATSSPRTQIASSTSLAGSADPAVGSHTVVQSEPRAIARTSEKEKIKPSHIGSSVVKREPASPDMNLAKRFPTPAPAAQPLFNPPAYSPEERKPEIRHGFTPPARPQLLPVTIAVAPNGQPQRSPASSAGEPVTGSVRTGSMHAMVEGSRPEPPKSRTAESNTVALSRSTKVLPSTALATSFAHLSRGVSERADDIGRVLEPSSGLQAVKPVKPEVLADLEDMDMDDSEADMEIDELASDTSAQATDGLSTVAVRNALPREHVFSKGIAKAPSAGRSPTATPSLKGKERALDSGAGPIVSSKGARPTASSIQVIDLADSDDAEAEVPPPRSLASVAVARAKRPVEVTQAPDKSVTSTSTPTIQSSSAIGSKSREERTRVFPLPPKVLSTIQSKGGRPKSALRRFLDDKYEELEVDLGTPLKRIDEIPKDGAIRLVYVEVDLTPNEIAIPLPQECLRSNGGSSGEREQRRLAFTTQQIVQLAKQGKEAETTRLTSAHVIVSLKPYPGAAPSIPRVSSRSVAGGQTDPVAGQTPPFATSTSTQPSVSTALPSKANPSLLEEQRQAEKKRKRKEGLADDTASISSVDSTISTSRKKEKLLKAKQARIPSDLQAPTTALAGPSGLLPAPQQKVVHSSLPPSRSQKVADVPASVETRLTLREPQITSAMHRMHGSLSNKLKGSLEKPRMFFRAAIFNQCYLAVSMRGHLHYWSKGLDTASLISEDSHVHASLSVQAALWSDQHRLAVIAHTSSSAAVTANLQIVNIYNSKVRLSRICEVLPRADTHLFLG